MNTKPKRKSPPPYVETPEKVASFVELFNRYDCEYLGLPVGDKLGKLTFRFVRFKSCGHEQNVAYSNANKDKFSGFVCNECRENNKNNLFEKHNYQLISKINKDTFLVRKPCGHESFAYKHHMKKFDTIVCSECVKEKHEKACEALNLRFVEKVNSVKAIYEFKCCGTQKELFKSAVNRGNCVCPVCNSSWFTQPSKLYLFELELENGFKFLKFGYGKNLSNRIREYRLKNCKVTALILSFNLPSGFIAMTEELKIHANLKDRLDAKQMKKYFTRGGYSECYKLEQKQNILDQMLSVKNKYEFSQENNFE
jgi:hypothetical protein